MQSLLSFFKYMKLHLNIKLFKFNDVIAILPFARLFSKFSLACFVNKYKF